MHGTYNQQYVEGIYQRNALGVMTDVLLEKGGRFLNKINAALNESEFPRCYSSKLMTILLICRNTDLLDENSTIKRIANKILFGCKVLITAIALPHIAAWALAEAAVYPMFLSLFGKMLKSRYHARFERLSESCKYTLLWTIHAFFCNLFFSKVLVNESDYRK